MNKTILVAALIMSPAQLARATDVINQDNQSYKLKVQSEGKLSISNYVIKPKTSMYGLCSASFCSFEIAGSKIMAKKDERVTIRAGKFVK
jgi:hypothetical protein